MTGLPIPYKIGQRIVMLIGPEKGKEGTVIGESPGHPRRWVMVKYGNDELMFDWHEIKLAESETEKPREADFGDEQQ